MSTVANWLEEATYGDFSNAATSLWSAVKQSPYGQQALEYVTTDDTGPLQTLGSMLEFIPMEEIMPFMARHESDGTDDHSSNILVLHLLGQLHRLGAMFEDASKAQRMRRVLISYLTGKSSMPLL